MTVSIRILTSLACIAVALLCIGSVSAEPSLPITTTAADPAPAPSAEEALLLSAEEAPTPSAEEAQSPAITSCCPQDRVFLVSTRHLCYDACRARLDKIPFRVWQIGCGKSECLDPSTFESMAWPGRPVVIYIHGNRMPADEITSRASSVRRQIRARCMRQPVDWVVFSWPSDREMAGVKDFREKADRCDAQGLYLASLMRNYVEASTPMVMIGYSFGARVATGALHALAGGRLAGRCLPTEPVTGANVNVGLVAPAIESNWLGGRGYHGHATKNMNQLVLLYNRRDVVLKRYWLLEKVRRETALGYSGPTCFAPRIDGSRLPVRSRDCSPSVKIRHSELDYYGAGCHAGCDMARLINVVVGPNE